VTDTIHALARVTGCVVVDSSGCHRYDYWNEQALFDGRDDTGWCSPSRAVATTEFLEVDLRGRYAVAGLRMLSRAINENAGFPGRIEVEALDGDGWTLAHIVKDVRCELSTWYEVRFPETPARRLRLLLADAGRRPEGKYFTQFMGLEILHRPGGLA
jgi:hypothetical protein